VLLCWGLNTFGQGGVDLLFINKQYNINVTQVETGNGFNCVKDLNFNVKCWGKNKSGETDVPAELSGIEVEQSFLIPKVSGIEVEQSFLIPIEVEQSFLIPIDEDKI